MTTPHDDDASRRPLEQFDAQRARLHVLATQVLGSSVEADDALQDTWLRVERADARGVDNVDGWLTTVTTRVCLNRLRSRATRGEQPLDPHVADPVVIDPNDPQHDAVLADSVRAALSVVLESLSPAERVAFVLHDTFAMPFDEIAEILDRSVEATRKLASRARTRVRGGRARTAADLRQQRAVVDAFLAAARNGDIDGLVRILDPDIVARTDGGTTRPGMTRVVRGAAAVAQNAVTYANPAAVTTPLTADGRPALLVSIDGAPATLMVFTVADGRITAIDAIAEPERIVTLLPS